MKERHTALIVEDHTEIAEDLVDILQSVDCDGVVVNNRDDALSAVQSRSFCLILLDLQIKSSGGSIKAHVEYGRALLRKIRQADSEHNGSTFCLPILVVSGFARERDEAVDVMKDGASYLIQKPLDSKRVSEEIRHAFQASGRRTHELCHQRPPVQRPNFSEGVVISIPGDRLRRRTRVLVGGMPVELTDSSLKVLLRLLVAHQARSPVHKIELGASSEQGFKGVSILRNELKPVLAGIDIIENDYQGNYSFTNQVVIGECAAERLRKIGNSEISKLAEQLVGRKV